MYRSPWFWITIALIMVGIAASAMLGVLFWVVGVLSAAFFGVVVVFLGAAYAVPRAKSPALPAPGTVSTAERIPVIHDCDVAMGGVFRDAGGGLALLYLLGEPYVELVSVTATYGSGPVEASTRTARRLLEDVSLRDVPVFRGAAGPDEKPEANEAARHLVGAVGARPGEIALIATGCMTNLKHAAALDPEFFKKLRGLYLMGGATTSLVWNEHKMAELNFSLDPAAAYQAIHADCPVTIATGQAGLTAVFRSPQFAALVRLGDPVSRLIVRKVRFWFALMRLWFKDDGFAMWDSVAALALTHPDTLEYEQAYVTSTPEELRTGHLAVDRSRHGPIRLVRGVRDYGGFISAHFSAWQRLSLHVERERGK